MRWPIGSAPPNQYLIEDAAKDPFLTTPEIEAQHCSSAKRLTPKPRRQAVTGFYLEDSL